MYVVEKRLYGDIILYSAKCPKCGYAGYIGLNNTCDNCMCELPEVADQVKVIRESETWKRLQPNKADQERLLQFQDNKCAWCGCEFYSEQINEKTGRVRVPDIHFDHIVPYSYGGNLENNWAASCSICNSIKHNKYFSTYSDLYEYIRERRIFKGWPVNNF